MLKDIAEAMLGRRPFDLVIRNVQIVNVFSASIVSGSIGIVNGHIAGVFGPEDSWNYVAVGCGHGAQWWKEFFSTVRMAGYDGDVSLEMENLTMPMLEGHLTSLRVLKEALVL